MIGLTILVALVACGSGTSDDPSQTADTASQRKAAAERPEEMPSEQPAHTKDESPAAPEIALGNGEANWIVVEGLSRDHATLTFSEVRIDGNGWLVLHPFKDGKPVGDLYVGHTYIEDGDNRNVEITLDAEPAAGDMFIVMLHRDVNENQKFDFVFVDEVNVLDKAVFEDSVMIAHAIPVP
jgi:hypothetical protein